jgi:hypothetical protein
MHPAAASVLAAIDRQSTHIFIRAHSFTISVETTSMYGQVRQKSLAIELSGRDPLLDPHRLKAGGALTRAGRLAAGYCPLQQPLRPGPVAAPAASDPRGEVSQAGEAAAQIYLHLALASTVAQREYLSFV